MIVQLLHVSELLSGNQESNRHTSGKKGNQPQAISAKVVLVDVQKLLQDFPFDRAESLPKGSQP